MKKEYGLRAISIAALIVGTLALMFHFRVAPVLGGGASLIVRDSTATASTATATCKPWFDAKGLRVDKCQCPVWKNNQKVGMVTIRSVSLKNQDCKDLSAEVAEVEVVAEAAAVIAQ